MTSHQQPTQAVPALSAAAESEQPFITAAQRNALERLGAAYAEKRPLAILIGESKSGVGFLLRSFLDSIAEEAAVVRIAGRLTDALTGMREVIEAIGFDPKDMSLADLENVFTMFLSFQKTHRRRTVICIEETQDNGQWMLEQVRRLVELELRRRCGLMVLLAGRPALNELLNQAPLSAISAHAGRRIYVSPFAEDDTREYIRRRVEAAGFQQVGEVFEFDAITLLHERSEGLPDAVSNLYTECLLLADDQNTYPITRQLVEAAGKRLMPAKGDGDSDAIDMQLNGMDEPLIPIDEQLQPEDESTLDDVTSAEMGRLIAKLNGEVVSKHALKRGKYLIGRDELCEIRVDRPSVSRYHALIVSTSLGIKIVDLESTNGTLVNGRQIKKCMLHDHDKITVGDCRIDFHADYDRQTWFFDTDPTDSFAPDEIDPALRTLVKHPQGRRYSVKKATN